MIKEIVDQLWQNEKAIILPRIHLDTREIILRVFNREPPPPALEYYEAVPGGLLGGMPLIGVNFHQPAFNIIAEFRLYEPMILAGFWPIASDGLGNTFVCFHAGNDIFPVGFIDVLLDPLLPQYIVASSIEKLLFGMDNAGNDGGDWPCGNFADTFDPDRKILDKVYHERSPLRNSVEALTSKGA